MPAIVLFRPCFIEEDATRLVAFVDGATDHVGPLR
jgi:hypothetical protein